MVVRIKRLLLISCCLFLLSASELTRLTDPPDAPLRPVAEFERSQGVLISYPLGIPISFIADMSQDVVIYCLAASYQQANASNNFSSGGVNMDNVEFIIGSIDSYWTQDYGPFFVVDDNHEMVIVDFEYNRPRPSDNQAPYKMSDHLNVEYFDSDIVHNGGNLMFDGYFSAASSTIVFVENYNLDTDQMMNDYYGASNHLTLPDPTDNYHQHINCWAKFLSPEKIMIRSVPEVHQFYDEIEAVVEFYENQLNCFDEPYQIYRVYTPNDQPYANSFILNDKVYIPTSSNQWDDEAIESFQEALPGYEVFGIDDWSWLPTDALHCRVLAIPDIEMLQIFHDPVDNQEFPLEEYEITVIVDDLSETGVIDDSVRVFWKNSLMDDYEAIPLIPTENELEYSGAIPSQPIDTDVLYFITAADNSDRIERLPIAGYYTFNVIGGSPMEPGDVNLDGAQNILDIVMIVNHILIINSLTGYPLYLSDLNSDANINILDVIVLINLIVR